MAILKQLSLLSVQVTSKSIPESTKSQLRHAMYAARIRNLVAFEGDMIIRMISDAILALLPSSFMFLKFGTPGSTLYNLHLSQYVESMDRERDKHPTDSEGKTCIWLDLNQAADKHWHLRLSFAIPTGRR